MRFSADLRVATSARERNLCLAVRVSLYCVKTRSETC